MLIIVFVFVFEIDLAGNIETIRFWFSEIKRPLTESYFTDQKKKEWMDTLLIHSLEIRCDPRASEVFVVLIDQAGRYCPLIFIEKTNYQGFCVIHTLAFLKIE